MGWKEIDRRLIGIGKELVEVIYNILKVDDEQWKEELEEMNRGKREVFYTFLPKHISQEKLQYCQKEGNRI